MAAWFAAIQGPLRLRMFRRTSRSTSLEPPPRRELSCPEPRDGIDGAVAIEGKRSDRICRTTSCGLLDQMWGYDVCGSITANHPKNRERIGNVIAYNSHFRAYSADLRTTRRFCVGDERDCATCFDVWAHMSWIMLNFS